MVFLDADKFTTGVGSSLKCLPVEQRSHARTGANAVRSRGHHASHDALLVIAKATVRRSGRAVKCDVRQVVLHVRRVLKFVQRDPCVGLAQRVAYLRI